jgi:hypothetical protein
MMKIFLLYLGSGLLAAFVGYLINQLPNLPDSLKPWVPIAIALLVIIGAIFAIKQSSQGAESSATVIRGTKIRGNRNRVQARNALLENNTVTGDDNSINTSNSDSGETP